MAFDSFNIRVATHPAGSLLPCRISERESKSRKSNKVMSVPIQTTCLNELKGGQKPLTSDDRRGNEHNQVFPLTGRPGTPVNNDQPASAVKPNLENGAASRPSASVSGLNAGSGRGIAVKPV